MVRRRVLKETKKPKRRLAQIQLEHNLIVKQIEAIFQKHKMTDKEQVSFYVELSFKVLK